MSNFVSCLAFRRSSFTLIAIYLIFITSCDVDNSSANNSFVGSSGKQLFTEVTSVQSKVKFINKLIDDPLDPKRNVMDNPHYFNGAGTAIADFDNDGLADLFFVGNEVQNKIYKNLGGFEFKDMTSAAKVNDNKNWANGVTIVDINNDGYNDIYVCQSSHQLIHATAASNVLYVNNGDFTFTERASEYGLDNRDLSHQASFFDYDLDGDLDCFILNTSIYVRVQLGSVFKHLDTDKKNVEAASCKLYENRNGKYVNFILCNGY